MYETKVITITMKRHLDNRNIFEMFVDKITFKKYYRVKYIFCSTFANLLIFLTYFALKELSDD